MKTTLRRTAAFLSGLGAITVSQGEVLDTLREYGNAATADATSGAGIARGFTNPAAGEYTITAGGTDIWGNSDHGTFIHDADVVQAGDFSAVVRVSSIGETGEYIPPEWGRTGIMARVDPQAANSPNVAHMRKSGGGGNAFTTQQWRDTFGGGTARAGSEHGNAAANTANGTVDDTPLWVALHRYDGVYYTTWADDVAGSPGTWSDSRQHNANADTGGDVYVGLAHQNHGAGNPGGVMTSTATFDSFDVGPFDPDLGDFPVVGSCAITWNGLTPQLTASGEEVGNPGAVDVDWEVRYLGEPGFVPGLRANIYNIGNPGNLGNFDNMVANNDPWGSPIIANPHWSEPGRGFGYPPEFNASTGAFTGNQEQFSVDHIGEIFIPELGDRAAGNETSILFKDGVDDFAYLEIDGQQLVNDNDWTGSDGTRGGNPITVGSPIVSLDVSDSKFDDGEWVPIRFSVGEGGGGDSGILWWSAFDTDGNYPTADIVPADNGDLIPDANFRTFAAALQNSDSGSGQPDAEELDPIEASTTALEVYINGSLIKTIPIAPTIATADFTSRDEVTITLEDIGGARDVDTANLSVLRDGVDVTGMVSISKVGTTTTIVDTFASEPPYYTDFIYEISGVTTPTTQSVPFMQTATVTSYAIREELRPGLDPAPNASEGWDVMEFDVIAANGAPLGGNEASFRGAQDIIHDADILARATQPYINHADPDTNATSGDWNPDLPILGDDVGLDDNDYLTFARTVITIGAGEEGVYTIRIRGDDGHGLRIRGANALSSGGPNGNNRIDARDDTAFYPLNTGDCNSFHVFEFPAPGDYPVEFFGFEGGGGSFQEIAWTPGAVTAFGQSVDWQLLGNTDGFTPQNPWAAIDPTVVPPLPTGGGEEGWGFNYWYNASVGSLANTITFLNSNPPDPDFSGFQPVLNHSDDDTGDQGDFGGDLPYPGDPAGGTDNMALMAHARLVAPVDGDYTVQVRSDDGFLFRFLDPSVQIHTLNGVGTISGGILNEFFFAAGTGNSQTRASVFLTAGTYDVHFVWWEGGGGSYFEVSSAPGVVANHGVAFELLSATPSETNLYLGIDMPAPFTITEVVRNDATEEFSVTFNSRDGADYAVDLSLDLNTGAWIEATDLPGEGESTTFTATYAELRGVLGIPPGDPLPDTLLARVRDIALQGDPNP